MATGTPNYDFPLLDGQETVDIVNDVNALANSVDSALKTVEGASDRHARVRANHLRTRNGYELRAPSHIR